MRRRVMPLLSLTILAAALVAAGVQARDSTPKRPWNSFNLLIPSAKGGARTP